MNIILAWRGSMRLLLMAFAIVLLVGCGSDNDNTPSDDSASIVNPPAAVSGEQGIKLMVNDDGVYRVSLDAMKQAGLNIAALDVTQLSLTDAGNQVPFLVDGASIVFYGQAADTRYNTQRPYLLTPNTPGLEMELMPAPAVTEPVVETVPQEIKVEENLYYEQRAAEADGEVYFWQKIVSDGEEAKFETTFDVPVVGINTQLMMHFYGLTYNSKEELDHDFEVSLNGQPLGLVQFDGDTYYLSTTAVDPALVKQGENTVLIDNSAKGAAFLDQVFLDYIALAYEMPTSAVNGHLSVKERNGLLKANGFTTQPLALNVANRDKPQLMINWNYADGVAQMGVTSDMAVELVSGDGFLQVADIQPLRQTTLRDTNNQADMLIVTTQELAPELAPLIKARQEQGIKSQVTYIEDLYDEFGYGDTTPYAVQNFVQYAVDNWQKPAPRYLFIVADATTDTLGYEANRPKDPVTPPKNVIPSPIIKVSFGGETVSDARMGDADGDFKPDVAVGRWPADSPAAVRDLVERTLSYEQSTVAPTNAVFSSDPSSETEFTGFTNRLIERTSFPTEHALLFNSEDNSEMLAAWQDAWLVSYVGHGSLELWGEDELLTKEQVSDIKTGETPPIVLQFSCLTGQFAHPDRQTISEKMLLQNDGPVLIVAATSLSLSGNQSPFAINLMNALRSPVNVRIGDALQEAKTKLDVTNSGLREISDTFGLIGDPSALIIRPQVVLQDPVLQQ